MPGYVPKDQATIDLKDSDPETSDSDDDVETTRVLEFPLGDLPQELRDMIWDFAIDNDPRVVEIMYDNRLGIGRTKFASKTLVPATMHTCHAARERALKNYVMLEPFGDRRSYKETYIRWDTDAVLFQTWQGLERFISRHEAICEEEFRNLLTTKTIPGEKLQTNRFTSSPCPAARWLCARITTTECGRRRQVLLLLFVP